MKQFILSFSLLLILANITITVFCQENNGQGDYYKENYLRYYDKIYNDQIHAVRLHNTSFELSDPILKLGQEEQLMLSFDDFEGGVKNYKYTLIHCSSDWHPSDLQVQEYIEGYTDDYIRDYKFSFNTLQSYTHYQVTFPNDNFKLIKPGNYIVLVYPEDNKDAPVITRRFYLVETRCRIDGQVRQAIDLEERYAKQQVQFSVYSSGFQFVNPFRNVKVTVKQNGRTDNMITDLKPLLAKGSELDYNHINGNVFDGGNEYRHFDIKSVKYSSDRVARIDASGQYYSIYLMNDERRSSKVYVTDDDINGRMLIKTVDGDDADIESDYVDVNFTLPFAPYISTGNLYIMGECTNWLLSKESMMKYNFDKKQYEGKLHLKQGYYNYQYVFLENGFKIADVGFIEGNHFETENVFTIFVYYQEPGTIYEKLIGVQQLISNRKK
jgi:hypothetical protein